jgi:hypothetical protein
MQLRNEAGKTTSDVTNKKAQMERILRLNEPQQLQPQAVQLPACLQQPKSQRVDVCMESEMVNNMADYIWQRSSTDAATVAAD